MVLVVKDAGYILRCGANCHFTKMLIQNIPFTQSALEGFCSLTCSSKKYDTETLQLPHCQKSDVSGFKAVYRNAVSKKATLTFPDQSVS